MSVNISSNPYYDDFNESKNYVKILFKPSFAVQARELTQLQTAIQKQIERFGSSIYKEGSIVLNGESHYLDVQYIDIIADNTLPLVGNYFEGLTSKARGKTFLIETISEETNLVRLYFLYATGTEFEKNEVIKTPTGVEYNIIDSDNFYGVAKAFAITPSVFFTKGYFVYCEEQAIIVFRMSVPDEGISQSKIAGLKIDEKVVTSLDDPTLLDPAQGSYNFAAPGADRLSITLTLTSFDFDPSNENFETPEDFIELARFEGGFLTKKVSTQSYSDLDTTLARRTFEQAGDYTVTAFGIKIKDYVYDTPDKDEKLTIAIDPGKAYVKGYEFGTTATTNIALDRARETEFRSGRVSQVDFGDYFFITTPTGGVLSFTQHPTIDLYDGVTQIGTARVRAIDPVSANRYKLFVYNINSTSINSITKVQSGAWEANIDSSAYDNLPSTLVKSERSSFIVPLPNKNIKTLLPSDTQYTTHRSFSASVAGNTTVLTTGSSDEFFFSTNPLDYYAVNSSTGEKVVVNSVTPTSPTSRTLVFAVASVNVVVYTQTVISNAAQKNKALQTATNSNVPLTTSKISLNYSDCFKLTSVIAKDNAVVLPNLDVTDLFEFNSGQKDHMYDHGWIQLKSGASIDPGYDVIDIQFSYFSHSSTTGFFSVDSYGGIIDYTDVPKFTSNKGQTYDLRDCIDFRPVRVNNGTTINGNYQPVTDTLVSTDYEFYLPRIDKLVITKDRKFFIVKGIAAEQPVVPQDMPDSMTLYVLTVPAYTHRSTDVSFTYIDNRRYTMRDIGKIEKRVERVEYYTTLSMLEKQARDSEIPSDIPGMERFKNGILVDSFAGHSVGAIENRDYSCSIEPEKRVLRPKFTPYSFEYTPVTMSNVTIRGDLVHLPVADSEILVNQPFATSWINVNPFLVFSWNGLVSLNPSTDTWIDVHTRPDVVVNLNGENDVFTTFVDNVNNPASVGVRWNDWQTVHRGVVVDDNLKTNSTHSDQQIGASVFRTTNSVTTNNQTTTVTDTMLRTGLEISTSSISTIHRDIGTRVVDTSIVPFIREREVVFSGTKLRPMTKMLAIFDDIDVTEYCFPALELTINVAVAHRNATRVRSGDKTADVALAKSNRLFVVMDLNSMPFIVGETIQYEINGAWVSGAAITAVFHPIKLETNEFGDVAGIFNIPNNELIKFRTGERLFKLTDELDKNARTAGATKYIAQGLSQSTERTIVATKVAQVAINPKQEVSSSSTVSTKNIVVESTRKVDDITPPLPPAPVPVLRSILCSSAQQTGSRGTFTYTINMGTKTGICGINYFASDNPSAYTLSWNGRSIRTGFIGATTFNHALNSNGFGSVVSTTKNGSLTLNKTSAYPTTVTVTVEAPLLGASWRFTPICAPTETTNPQYALTITGDNGRAIGNNFVFTVTARLSGGGKQAPNLEYGQFGRVNLTSSIAGSSFSSNNFMLRNGTSTTVTLTVPQNTSFFGNTGFDTGIVTGVATEFVEIAASNATDLTARTTWNYRVPRILDWGWMGGNGNGGGGDPIAQTFFVNSANYPDGVYINKLDLFFRKKSNSLPVWVQIRPVVNGYPSATDILPGGVSIKEPSDVNISTTGTVPTTFEFNNIVHLAPGEYSFVVIADTDEYELFTAILGEYSLDNPNVRVIDQPTLGSMFKSQNARTWTPAQEEDVKFTLYNCLFNNNVNGVVTFDTKIDPSLGDIDYHTFYTTGESVDFGTTNIGYQYNIQNGGWVNYQIGTNKKLESKKTLSTPDSLKLRTTLSTNNVRVTPVIDINRLSNVIVKNIINNDDTGETLSFGGAALSKYITRRVVLNTGFESTSLRVYLLANVPSETNMKVYYKVNTSNVELFDDNEYIEMNMTSRSSFSETGFSEYVFDPVWDTALENGDRFDTFSIKIVMLANENTTNVPQIRDLRVIALDD